MKGARKQWNNPIGRTVSLALMIGGVAFLLLSVLTGTKLIQSKEQEDSATVRWSVTAALAIGGLALAGGAVRPTWSLTVGNRGIGIKRLWRQTFVDYGSFESIRLGEKGKLRIVTSRGSIRIFPPVPDAPALVEHVNTLSARKQ